VSEEFAHSYPLLLRADRALFFMHSVIQQEESFQGLEETTTIWKEKEKEKEKENPSLLNYSIQPRPPSLSSTSSSTLPTSSTIRQRSQPSASAPASSSLSPNSPSSSEPNSKPPPPPPSLSPIHQFSSLPPPALRASAKSFESSLDKIVELVEVEARLRGLAKQIKGVKKRLRVEEKEGTREESTEEKCGGNKVGNRV